MPNLTTTRKPLLSTIPIEMSTNKTMNEPTYIGKTNVPVTDSFFTSHQQTNNTQTEGK